ncbi:ABC transporter permease [Pseudonocardia endophytica]|uniref:ABC transporter permease n=1 Tax=Pseudonocardia endophytica TaxID=401976 RepID=UPI001404EDE8|nr:ABC transporter permease [Pseudonocardia endophytica]
MPTTSTTPPADPAAGAAPRGPGGGSRRRRIGGAGLGLVLPVLLLAGWQLSSATGVLGAEVLPSPAAAWSTLVDLAAGGDLGEALAISLSRAAAGLVIGVAVGTVLGVLCGASPTAAAALNPTLQALRALPVLALVPLFIIWFGIGETSKVLMIALATTFPIYVNVLAAVAGVDRRHLELARVLRLGRAALVRRVYLPAALPSWFVGLRYASGLALVILVISEQVDADAGLGYLMADARTYYRVDVILAVIGVYGVLGVLTDRLVVLGERWSLRWA